MIFCCCSGSTLFAAPVLLLFFCYCCFAAAGGNIWCFLMMICYSLASQHNNINFYVLLFLSNKIVVRGCTMHVPFLPISSSVLLVVRSQVHTHTHYALIHTCIQMKKFTPSNHNQESIYLWCSYFFIQDGILNIKEHISQGTFIVCIPILQALIMNHIFVALLPNIIFTHNGGLCACDILSCLHSGEIAF